MSGRTDTHVAVVCNDDTFERFQFVGTKKQVQAAADEKVKELGKADTRIVLAKRPG